jgi:hypothetical protein
MQTSKAEPLDEMLEALDSLIRRMQERGLAESAQFLAIAKTQYLIESNDISDNEFRALCEWLDGKQPPERRNTTPSRTRRDSSLQGMRRAWQRPQDVPAGRGRRRAAVTSRT